MILITGADSFVGNHLVEKLVQAFDDEEFLITAKYRERNNFAERSRIKFAPLRLHINQDFSKLPDTLSTVIHVAAASSQETSADKLRLSNIVGVENLIQYSLSVGVERFIFMSSLSIHGEIATNKITANTSINRPSPYGESKRHGEIMLAEVQDKLPSISLRLPSVLGKGASNHWLEQVCRKALKQENISIFNPNDPFNNAIHVDDLSNFIGQLCKTDFISANAFPVGSDGMMTIHEIVERIIKNLKSRSKIKIESSNSTSFSIDINAAKKIGFAPRDIGLTIDKFTSDRISQNQF
jgi:UDP-glucose 4-epimerase